MTIKPFSPDEARKSREDFIPDFVIEAFNFLLGKKYRDNYSIIIKRGEAVDQIKLLMPPDLDFTNDWLDVEPLYEQNGWKVVYDSPSPGDSYEAYFEFTRKTK